VKSVRDYLNVFDHNPTTLQKDGLTIDIPSEEYRALRSIAR